MHGKAKKPANFSRKTKEKPAISDWFYGADTRIRTGDLILTKDALYLLSYISTLSRDNGHIIAQAIAKSKREFHDFSEFL